MGRKSCASCCEVKTGANLKSEIYLLVVFEVRGAEKVCLQKLMEEFKPAPDVTNTHTLNPATSAETFTAGHAFDYTTWLPIASVCL